MISEYVQTADDVSVLAVRAGELDLSPAKDLEALAARLWAVDGVKEEYLTRQVRDAFRARE